MAQPTTYLFAPYSATISEATNLVANIPVVLTTNIASGQTVTVITFAVGVAVLSNSVIFDVSYQNLFGNIQKAVVSVPTTANSKNSLVLNYATQIISVIPRATSTTGTVTLEVQSKATKPYLCDVWNKAALYSYSIMVTVAGEGMSIQPQYALNPLPKWVSKNQIGAQADYSVINWVNMIAPQNPPITAAGTTGASFPNFPITAMRFQVTDTDKKTEFTATIMQQGGFF